MLKIKVVLTMLTVAFSLFVVTSCGQNQQSYTSSDNKNPAISASQVFNVSGAKAIATASSATVNGSALKNFSSANVTELLKLNSSGSLETVFSSDFSKQWHPPISVIEVGPDGSLYVGFRWGIWISDSSSSEGGRSVAFFRVKTNGSVEHVDENIYGVGTWHGDSNNGELPNKQVQFDSTGNVYYLGEGKTGTTVLKKKTTAGVISQIGTNKMAVRDFLVTPSGMVFFHGSNADNWNKEWLRVIYNGSVHNIFYNDGSSGWLRAYYYHLVGNTSYVYLVGEGLTLLDNNEVPQKYSGIIRVTLSSSGEPSNIQALYDDNNMYSENYNSIGDQLTWGYWDPQEMTNKKFFATDNYNALLLPLSLEAGVTQAGIREFIRKKYQSITVDTLASVEFTAVTTTETWRISNILTDLINANISGKSWAKWRQENELYGVRFGNAKQLMFSDSGTLYALITLDQWGSGSSKGEKLFRIVDSAGNASIEAFLQDSVHYYKSMSRARIYKDSANNKEYAFYLSNKVGKYKILRLDLSSPGLAPVDMLPNMSNAEIFSFNFDPLSGMLMYDVYDQNNNTSYLAQQALTSTTVSSQISAEGYTLTDVVPFKATN